MLIFTSLFFFSLNQIVSVNKVWKPLIYVDGQQADRRAVMETKNMTFLILSFRAATNGYFHYRLICRLF